MSLAIPHSSKNTYDMKENTQDISYAAQWKKDFDKY